MGHVCACDGKVHEQYDLIVTPSVSDVAPLHTQFPMEESVRQALEHMDELSVPEQQSVIWRMFDRTLALTPFTQLSILRAHQRLVCRLF